MSLAWPCSSRARIGSHWLEALSADVLRGSSTAHADAGREAWCYWQNTPGQWLNQWREPWAADDELLDALRRPPGDVAGRWRRPPSSFALHMVSERR